MESNDYNYLDRLKCLNLVSLSVRRDVKVIKLINRIIINDNTPLNWSNILEFKRTERHGNLIKTPKTRINLCDQNFFGYAIKLYNSLPINLRKSDNFTLHIKDVENYLCNLFNENFVLNN